MQRQLPALVLAVAMTPALLLPPEAAAAAPATPAAITSVTARPGPGTGQVTLSWRQSGKNTTGFRLVTALNTFSRSSTARATTGRRSRVTALSASRRSITLTARQVLLLGGGVASGNALFFRFYAVNARGGRTAVRAYPYLRTVLPMPAAPKAKGTKLRIATFNVRTARATKDKRSWNQRAGSVARQILSRRPGVVAIQELGPGRADGRTGTTKGTPRQTSSLESALARNGGKRYQLTRTTPYVAAGQKTATQGTRILYDTSRYSLVNRCPEKTGSRSYSSACSFKLPIMRGDDENDRRRAALAQFRDRRTGKRFWVVSVHLDARHSSKVATERRYDALRRSQANAAAAGVARYNRARLPVILGGDLNSWQNSRVANSAHDHLVHIGYYDASAARTRVNFRYTTYTAFKTSVTPASHGVGVRLDQLLVKGVRGASRYENVLKARDGARPSDHNLVVSDIVL